MKKEIEKIIEEFMETQQVDGAIDVDVLAEKIIEYIELYFI